MTGAYCQICNTATGTVRELPGWPSDQVRLLAHVECLPKYWREGLAEAEAFAAEAEHRKDR